jgi:hypothetical protein
MIEHACAVCAATPSAPCAACRHNQAIKRLHTEHAALTEVYAVAARLRTFPVSFDDHWALVGAVDACRSVLEPPIDNFAPERRDEFLAEFRQAHAILHRLWTDAAGKDGYDKATWKLLDNALSRFARDAASQVGIAGSEPLL